MAVLGDLEETMAWRILSGGAIAVLAGAAMLAASSAPSPAFTLSSPSLEQPVVGADVQSVWWHGGWQADGTAVASRMGLASGVAAGIAGAWGWGPVTASPRGFAGGAPRRPPLRSLTRGSVERRRRAALALHLRHQRLGNLEVGGDVLNVVVVFERADETQDLFARLVVDGDRVLRPPDDCGLDRARRTWPRAPFAPRAAPRPR